MPRLSKTLFERRIAGEVCARNHWVHEVTGDIGKLGPASAGCRHTYQNLLLPGVAMKKNLEGGQQDRERRGAFSARESL